MHLNDKEIHAINKILTENNDETWCQWSLGELMDQLEKLGIVRDQTYELARKCQLLGIAEWDNSD